MCYIFKEWFYISIIFHYLYFIIRFGRDLNYSGKEFRCIVIGCSFTLMHRGYDYHYCHNKPPDRKWGWSVDDVMPRRDGSENLRIWKESVEIRPWRQRIEFSIVAAVVKFFGSQPIEMNWDFRHHKMHHLLGWGQHSKNCVSFLVSPWTEFRSS